MIKKLDIYIIKKFLGAYFLSIILLISIAIVFDITEKIDNFESHDAPLDKIVFDYYVNFVPFYANLFSSLFAFIAVIFFTSKMAVHTEVIAILSSGISYIRFLRPYIISAIVIAALSFYLGGYVIPPGNKERLEFEQIYVKGYSLGMQKDVYLEVEPGKVVYVKAFENAGRTGKVFLLETYKDNRMLSKLTAERLEYDTVRTWTAYNFLQRDINESGETITRGDSITLTLDMEPKEFVNSKRTYQTMTNSELRSYISRQEARGVGNISEYKIELQRRYSDPISALILTIIGASIASRKVRGGTGVQIFVGFLMAFSFILLSGVSTSFAKSGLVSAEVSVWLPSMLYLLFAVYYYRKAQK